jgi:hypothetical protein
VLAGRRADRALPVDPALGYFRDEPVPTGFGRFAPIQMFRAEVPDELERLRRESCLIPVSDWRSLEQKGWYLIGGIPPA